MIKRMLVRDYTARPSVSQLLKHPRLRLMVRRRKCATKDEEIEGKLLPIMRPVNNDVERPCTPPNNGYDEIPFDMNCVPSTPANVANNTPLVG